jgi:hypothetical protein
MKLPNDERVLLQYLYSRFVDVNGNRQSKLTEFTIFVLEPGLKTAVPHLFSEDASLKELKHAFRELAARGLVRIHGADRNYSLTKEGFDEASQGRSMRILDFLNRNTGLAIGVSIISLIVAVIALFRTVA